MAPSPVAFSDRFFGRPEVRVGGSRPDAPAPAPSGEVVLPNLGATCYLNSVLQVLSAVVPRRFYETALPEDGPAHALLLAMHRGGPVMPELRQLVKEVQRQMGRSEQDAQECWGLLTEMVIKGSYAFPKDYLYGKSQTVVKCRDCGHRTVTADEFSTLVLHLRPNENITETFRRMLQREPLGADYACDACGKRNTSQRYVQLMEAPSVLVMHLSRFQFGDACTKLGAEFEFPREWMDISPILGGSKRNHMYRLKAVVDHWGTSCTSGHYTARVRGRDKQWRLFDDAAPPALLDRKGGGDADRAYLIVYVAEQVLD